MNSSKYFNDKNLQLYFNTNYLQNNYSTIINAINIINNNSYLDNLVNTDKKVIILHDLTNIVRNETILRLLLLFYRENDDDVNKIKLLIECFVEHAKLNNDEAKMIASVVDHVSILYINYLNKLDNFNTLHVVFNKRSQNKQNTYEGCENVLIVNIHCESKSEIDDITLILHYVYLCNKFNIKIYTDSNDFYNNEFNENIKHVLIFSFDKYNWSNIFFERVKLVSSITSNHFEYCDFALTGNDYQIKKEMCKISFILKNGEIHEIKYNKKNDGIHHFSLIFINHIYGIYCTKYNKNQKKILNDIIDYCNDLMDVCYNNTDDYTDDYTDTDNDTDDEYLMDVCDPTHNDENETFMVLC
jgi:hypothetical protein